MPGDTNPYTKQDTKLRNQLSRQKASDMTNTRSSSDSETPTVAPRGSTRLHLHGHNFGRPRLNLRLKWNVRVGAYDAEHTAKEEPRTQNKAKNRSFSAGDSTKQTERMLWQPRRRQWLLVPPEDANRNLEALWQLSQ